MIKKCRKISIELQNFDSFFFFFFDNLESMIYQKANASYT